MKKLLLLILLIILLTLMVSFFSPYVKSDFMDQFLPNFAATIFGGVILTSIFFYLKEHVFPYPDISGVWEATETTGDSSHFLYKGMKVVYKIVLLQEGNTFFGSGERDREYSVKNSAMTYSGPGRVRISIEGVIDKKYFGFSTIRLHWVEDGKRETSTVHRLLISGSNYDCNLWGSFYKTAANSSGTVFWKRISN